MQARDISPGHLGSTLRVLLSGTPTDGQEGAKQWSAHIASAADAAVQAAEASFGVEGAHEAALARAQAVVMATDGFTAQVCSALTILKCLDLAVSLVCEPQAPSQALVCPWDVPYMREP